MYMVYIRYNGNITKQEVRTARNLEMAMQSSLFDFITENDIDFLDIANVKAYGHKV